MDRFNRRPDRDDERISELEDRFEEIIQNAAKRDNMLVNKKERVKDTEDPVREPNLHLLQSIEQKQYSKKSLRIFYSDKRQQSTVLRRPQKLSKRIK